MSTVAELTASTLRDAWRGLQEAKPGLRIRECAEQLGVSEAQLLATTVGDYTTKLEGDWAELLKRLPELGRVMSLTRNDSCVLEHKGTFQKIDIMGAGARAMATVIGPIETRVFFAGWKFGFAVCQETPRGLQRSIQIFDQSGTAITKIYLVEEQGNKRGSNPEAFDKIVADYTSPDQSTNLKFEDIVESPTKLIPEVDAKALMADWAGMKDTHDFFGILRKHNVNRLDALYLAPDYAYQLKKESLQHMLETAAQNQLPIMIFAGNRGNLQIHQGKVQTIRVMEQWLNVLDPDFNMHLRADHMDTLWVVKKPTADGVVTSLEAFDNNKNMIAQFFGLRKPGIPELKDWAALVERLDRV
jgi:putative hemin transport protein